MTSILLVVFTGLAAAGFGAIAVRRFRLAADSYRSGNRLELIRSSVLGLVMSFFAVGAAYGSLTRCLALLDGPHH
jgi:hypothetical protein